MLPDMKCPECSDENSVSTGSPVAWLIPWSMLVMNGKLHAHNPNEHVVSFRCTNGHKWVYKWFPACPTCHYKAGLEKKYAIK